MAIPVAFLVHTGVTILQKLLEDRERRNKTRYMNRVVKPKSPPPVTIRKHSIKVRIPDHHSRDISIRIWIP